MITKGFIIGLILLLIGTCVLPIPADTIEKPLSPTRGDVFYVGGSGPGNYTRIQDAINASSSGDTVFVYAGIYYEKFVYHINLSVTDLNLIGENRDTTIIDGNGTGIIVNIWNSTISGFTIQNGSRGIQSWSTSITNNRIRWNDIGIALSEMSGDNVIKDNIIESNGWGIANIQEKNMGGKGMSNISIFHNNFWNNSLNGLDFQDSGAVWDKGYPTGGNYWDDYNGVDNFSGPSQNLSGSDGIGDTPYKISEYLLYEAYDNYPLMNPSGSPQADFSWLSNGFNVIFNDSSTDADGTIIAWLWDFGEGNTSNQQNPTHTYPYAGTYTVTLSVTDNEGLPDTETKEIVITAPDSEPPSTVTGLTVTDAKDGKLNLVWDAATDNVAVHHYKIYRDNLFLINKTSTSYRDTGLTNGQSYTYKVSAVDAAGNEGNASDSASGTPTKSSGGGGGQVPPSEPENKKPLADASAGEPYQGFVNSPILFDGSNSQDPDGVIILWYWVFSDNTTGTGKKINHTFSKTGTYNVTLVVTDNQGAINTDTTTCIITKPNTPPTKPTISGPTYGTKNTRYDYTVLSTDADKDTISYSMRWDFLFSDQNTSGFLPSGTQYTFSHRWTTPGIYTITVWASDNQTDSQPTNLTVLIDVRYVRDLGYLINQDEDSMYDMFYSNSTMIQTSVQKQADGLYLIDNDGDGEWDHTYNPATSTLLIYTPKTPGFELIVVFCAIAVLLLVWRKKRIF